MITDSEEEVSGFHHSLDSSPQDERAPAGAACRYDNHRARPQYTSDYGWSDVSSSMETTLGLQGKASDRFLRAKGRYPLGVKDYTEDESSDSAASSEFSTTQTGSISGVIPASRACAPENCASNVTSQLKAKGVLEKVRV